MQKFSKFYFNSFEFDKLTLQAVFHYSFDNEVFFDETIDFKNELFSIREDIDNDILNNILFNIHLALGISYYKAFPTSELIVETGYLDDFQINFWKTFYINGLGEFFYTNNISPSGLLNFVNNSNIKYEKKDFTVSDKSLVAIGGGKDSIVSIELLKKVGFDFELVVFGKVDELKQFTSVISGKKILQINRQLSSKLFELNKQGYYNGHVPITGIIAFVLELVTYLFGYKYIVLSNEKSASFGNTMWKGLNINHQYSKSLDFEKDFGEYVFRYITSDVKYFSLLRGMYEIKIAELFTKYAKQYFNKFSSCNNNFKINKVIPENSNLSDSGNQKLLIKENKYWCNNCPKCAFVFSILRPYLTSQEVIDIFGEDLYSREDLEKLFRELLGISGIKPFECVGEAEEVIYSMYLTLNNFYSDYDLKGKQLPFILNIFSSEVLPKMNNNDFNHIQKKLVTIYNDDIIPTKFKQLIFKEI